jgi:hypothetical protein
MAVEKFVMKGKKPVIDKDPDAVLDYTVDFSAELLASSDTIASAEVVNVVGVVVDSVVFDDTTVTAWVSGGTVRLPGQDYASITYRITTVNNPARISDRTVFFNVLEK